MQFLVKSRLEVANMFAVSKIRKLRSEELISSPHVLLSETKVVDRLSEDFVLIFFYTYFCCLICTPFIIRLTLSGFCLPFYFAFLFLFFFLLYDHQSPSLPYGTGLNRSYEAKGESVLYMFWTKTFYNK